MDDKQVCEGLQSGSWSCFDEGRRENMTTEKSDYFSLFPRTEMIYVYYELSFQPTFLLFRGCVCVSKTVNYSVVFVNDDDDNDNDKIILLTPLFFMTITRW